jgi:nucleoside-diphosphate-sugar epimerase
LRIFVTGATGFIGNAFVTSALQADHEVAALVRPGTTVSAYVSERQNFRLFEGSLDQAPLEKIEQFRPDICVHAAWITTPATYLQSPANFKFLDWSFDLIKRIRESGTRRFLVLGTCVEYAPTIERLSESNSKIAPATPYAQCKTDLRIKLENLLQPDGSSLCWARVFYPYGVGEHPDRLCSAVIRNMLAGKTTLLKTAGSVKDYIYIDDLATAMLTLVENNVAGPINLGTGAGVSIETIACSIATRLNRPELIQTLDQSPEQMPDRVVADATKLRSLGWYPNVGLQEGIEKLIRFHTA